MRSEDHSFAAEMVEDGEVEWWWTWEWCPAIAGEGWGVVGGWGIDRVITVTCEKMGF